MRLNENSIRPLGVDTDFETILATARRRWWLAPILILLVGGVVLLRDPKTTIQPSYFRLDRNYQVVENTTALTLLGLPIDLLQPVPNLDTQLAELSESVEFKNLTAQFPNVSLNVRREIPTLAFQTQEDSEPVISLRGRIEPVLWMYCTEFQFASCDVALNALRDLVTTRHDDALRRGTQLLLTSVDGLKSQANKTTSLKERLETVELGLRAMESQPLSSLILVKEFDAEEDETVVTEPNNYQFTIALATILLLLVILQWSVLDKTIYGVRRIARTLGSECVLAHVRDKNDVITISAVGVALSRLVQRERRLRVLAARGTNIEFMNVVMKESGVEFDVVDLTSASSERIMDGSSPILIVAQRKITSMVELSQLSEVSLISSGIQPGVLLLG